MEEMGKESRVAAAVAQAGSSRKKITAAVMSHPPGFDEKIVVETSKIDPKTPAKSTKRHRSVVDRKKKAASSTSQTPDVSVDDDDDDLRTFAQVVAPGVRYNIKFQIIALWYRTLYSQTRPKSITFVAADVEANLCEVVVSDVLSPHWESRLQEGSVYVFRRLLSSENEKRINVVESTFQLNITKGTKCTRLLDECLHSNLMLPLTKLSELAVVRPRELYLRHFVAYVIDVRPLSVRIGKQGDVSRFVEVYIVDETLPRTAVALTIWDNIFESHEDLFGHGFTKPFIVTILGLKVRDFGGRNTLSTSNFTSFFSGPACNAAATALHTWVTTALPLKVLQRSDLLYPERLITLSEHPEIKTIHQVRVSTPTKLSPGQELEFVVHGMITDIDIHKQIHYEACDKCKRSAKDRTTSSTACAFCGNSPLKVIPRFLLNMTISDSHDEMKVTAFDRDAQEILYMHVEKALEIRSQENCYDELKKLAHQALHSPYTFILSLNDKNFQFLHRSGYTIKTVEWIPRRCICNSDINSGLLPINDDASVSFTSSQPESPTSSGESYVEITGNSPDTEHGRSYGS